MQTPAFITHRTWWAAGRKRRAELLIITRGEQQTFINGLLQSDGAWPTRCVWLIQTRAGSMCDTPGEKNPTHTHLSVSDFPDMSWSQQKSRQSSQSTKQLWKCEKVFYSWEEKRGVYTASAAVYIWNFVLFECQLSQTQFYSWSRFA